MRSLCSPVANLIVMFQHALFWCSRHFRSAVRSVFIFTLKTSHWLLSDSTYQNTPAVSSCTLTHGVSLCLKQGALECKDIHIRSYHTFESTLPCQGTRLQPMHMHMGLAHNPKLILIARALRFRANHMKYFFFASLHQAVPFLFLFLFLFLPFIKIKMFIIANATNATSTIWRQSNERSSFCSKEICHHATALLMAQDNIIAY